MIYDVKMFHRSQSATTKTNRVALGCAGFSLATALFGTALAVARNYTPENKVQRLVAQSCSFEALITIPGGANPNVAEIEEMGPKAVPYLLHELTRANEPLRGLYYEGGGNITV